MAISTKPKHLGLHNVSRSRANSAPLAPVSSDRLAIPTKKIRGFVELLARSNFSFLQGASHPEEMVEQAIRLNYSGIAICDLNGLYGVARGFQAATNPSHFTTTLHAAPNFKYLLGTELILVDESSLILMPLNLKGYTNLCEILTIGKRQAHKGFSKLSIEDIRTKSEDLLAFALPPIDEARYDQLEEIFKERLYLPVWRDLTWESIEACEKAFVLEKTRNAKLFVTNRPFMHDSLRKPIFDTLTCLLHKTTVSEAKNILLQNAERHLRPLHHLTNLWKDRLDLVEKTVEIADLVHFSLDQIRYRYPRAQLPDGLSIKQHLKNMTEEGLKWRYGLEIPDSVKKQAAYELTLISDLEYEDYFLTLHEICQFAEKNKIMYQGRGSAANSVVCFALGLTSVNPSTIDLLFERFISKERGEPPDIDIDFEHSRREEVIQHIYEKYNEKHAAMVCVVVRYRSRMALRETAKVLGVPLATVNRMIKFMGRDGIRRLVEDPQAPEKFQIDPHTWKLMLAIAKELYGFPRHLGIHSGGFLITQNPIAEMVPVEKATMDGRYVIQWNKDDVNFLKLMKIDILSLGMLTALRRCFHLLENHKKIKHNLANIPPDDVKTYEMICRADTVGVFQIESRAQMNTLPRLRPKNFYDIVVEVAIVRPGPLQGGMVHPYLRRRQGLEKTEYPHKDLIPILHKTHGVPIFQEQVMKIAIECAGFTPGEADELRRIMSDSWRKKSTMEGVRQKIMKGLTQHGINEAFAEQIYKTIEGFANYGFPESHAASFALLTYASCYIKCHHPDVFVCALLNSQPMGFYPPRVLIAEAQRNDVHFLNLDVQKSSYEYTLEEGKSKHHDVRVGLCSIHKVPRTVLENIAQEREQNGLYKNLQDFIRRTQTPKSLLLKLAAAGALQSFSENVRELMWQLEAVSLDQNSFLWGLSKESFSASVDTSSDSEDSEELESFQDAKQTTLISFSENSAIPFESHWESLVREYDHKGFSLHAHPMSILRSAIEIKNHILISNKYIPYVESFKLKDLKHRRKVRIAGFVGITQRPPTAKGMCFITLEDEFGYMNIVVPPQVYQKYRMAIYSKTLLEIHGTIEKTGALINIKADKVLPLGISKLGFQNPNYEELSG